MPDVERDKLNLETARIQWSELQTQFAGGRLIYVAPELDLVAVALSCARDDISQVQQWMDHGQVANVSDDQAKEWQDANRQFWAVVVKPWVLVQPLTDDS